jgi:hypothetical protein
MDRVLFGDELLSVFNFICCFLVFKYKFYFLHRCSKKVALSYVIRGPAYKCVRGCRHGKFVIGGKRVLATLCPIFYRVSEGTGDDPLTNSQEGIDNFCI